MKRHGSARIGAISAGPGIVAIMGLAVALAMPASAQTTTAANGDTTLPNGSLEKYHDNFRASEMVGAYVYDDKGNSIGKVNDLLVDTEGKTKSAVLSVGGFLGIASKYVEVPFEKLKVEPSRSSTTESASAGSATGAGATAGAGASTGPATPATPATPPAATASAPSKQYFSLVLPGATKDTLTSMPDFKYSS